jgi:hypothetical protein
MARKLVSNGERLPFERDPEIHDKESGGSVDGG